MKYLRAGESEVCSFQLGAENGPSKAGCWMLGQMHKDKVMRRRARSKCAPTPCPGHAPGTELSHVGPGCL